MINKKKSLVWVWALLVTCISLYSSISGAANKFDKVESLSVDPKVTLPDKAKFVGMSTVTTRAVGGGLLANAFSDDHAPEETLNALMREKEIDVGKILYGKVKAGLQKTKLSEKLGENASTQIKLTVNEFGLGKVPGAFKNSMQPYMSIRAQAIDAHGKVVWKNAAYMRYIYFRTLPVRPPEEWFGHPEDMADVFSQVAELLVADLLKDI